MTITSKTSRPIVNSDISFARSVALVLLIAGKLSLYQRHLLQSAHVNNLACSTTQPLCTRLLAVVGLPQHSPAYFDPTMDSGKMAGPDLVRHLAACSLYGIAGGWTIAAPDGFGRP